MEAGRGGAARDLPAGAHVCPHGHAHPAQAGPPGREDQPVLAERPAGGVRDNEINEQRKRTKMTPEWQNELARVETERAQAETRLNNALLHLAEVQASQMERDRRFREALLR